MILSVRVYSSGYMKVETVSYFLLKVGSVSGDFAATLVK